MKALVAFQNPFLFARNRNSTAKVLRLTGKEYDLKRSLMLSILAAFLLAACSGVEMIPPPQSPVPARERSPLPGATNTQTIPAITPTKEVQAPMSNTETPEGALRSSPGPTGSGGSNPYGPQPGDNALVRGRVFLDDTAVSLIKGAAPQAVVNMAGNLPTPCNKLRVAVSGPDASGRFDLQVYSLVSPNEVCAQMLKPFEATVILGIYPPGRYSVWVNGNEAGAVEMP